jgi:lipoprotein NlpI
MLATMASVTGSRDIGINRLSGCKECDMRGLLGPALAGAAVMFMLAPAAAQLSQQWASCVNQGGTFSADQRINGCASIIQSGQETPRKLAIAYYSRGLAYYDKGDDDRAIAEYNEAIRLDPKLAPAYSNRGLAYDHKGDLGRAEADYNEAIRLDPKYAQAYFHRGNAYYQKGDDDRAVADYSEAIRLDPKYAYAYNNRGTAYDRQGDHDRAIADYSEAIRLAPIFAQAYSSRGLAYYQKGDFDRAIADYGEAIRLDPKYIYAYNNRGNAYLHKHDESRAIADYSEAIRLDPKYAQAYFNRGVANLYADRLPNALADLVQSSELNPKYAYTALWLHIVDTRSNLPSQLAEAAKQIDMTKWPAPIIRLFLNQTTTQALFTTADDTDVKTKQRKTCEVNFYSAELALQRRAKDEAARLFRLAATECPKSFTEQAAALAELKALAASP